MGIRERLFGKGRHDDPQQVEPEQPLATDGDSVGAAAGSISGAEPSIPPAGAAVAEPAAAARDLPSLRSLTHYQFDPAFHSFQEKLHRPLGAKPSRKRLSPDEYPPSRPKAPRLQ